MNPKKFLDQFAKESGYSDMEDMMGQCSESYQEVEPWCKILERYQSECSIEDLNEQIKSRPDKGQVSDGYHTFDELYEHRCILYIALCAAINTIYGDEDVFGGMSVWRSRLHHDGSSFEGWFILGIKDAEVGQITYHLPERLWKHCSFASTLERGLPWDGHTSDDVLDRLTNIIDLLK